MNPTWKFGLRSFLLVLTVASTVGFPLLSLAQAQPQTYTVTIQRPVGAFIYAGAQLECGGQFNNGQGYTNCSATFAAGTAVHLYFIADTGYQGLTWSNDCAAAAANSACTLGVTKDLTVSGTSNKVGSSTLHLTMIGRGYVSSPYGGCSSTCDIAMTAVSNVILYQTATAPAWTFGSWAGDCDGADPCHLDMTQSRNVTLTFNAVPTHSISVVKPTGGFIYTQLDGGKSIECGGSFNNGQGYTDCSNIFVADSTVLFRFMADSGFKGIVWGGACAAAGTSPVCSIALSSDQTVSATFTK